MKPILAYITAKDVEEAKRLARKLLESRLVACVNVFSGVYSSFWWQDRIEQTEEAVIIAKSLETHRDSICELVKESHSYECPCVVFFQMDGGNQPYLDWIRNEVTPKECKKL